MIYFLIPSYNDSHNFKKLLKNISTLSGLKKKVVVVNDGSTDDTKQVFKRIKTKFPTELLSYGKNRGPGFAFNYGFKHILKMAKPEDLIITLEADNTSDIRLVGQLIKKSEKLDVVLASPYAKGGGGIVGISFDRKFLSLISNFLDKVIFQIPNVNTYTSFYRLYKVSALKKAKSIYKGSLIKEAGFPSVIEILVKLKKSGSKIGEVPSTVDWSNRKGKSHMKVPKTIYRHLIVYKNYLSGKYDR